VQGENGAYSEYSSSVIYACIASNGMIEAHDLDLSHQYITIQLYAKKLRVDAYIPIQLYMMLAGWLLPTGI
jgi:hypothetical protein